MTDDETNEHERGTKAAANLHRYDSPTRPKTNDGVCGGYLTDAMALVVQHGESILAPKTVLFRTHLSLTSCVG